MKTLLDTEMGIEIDAVDGGVSLIFDKPTERFIINPQSARELAQALVVKAKESEERCLAEAKDWLAVPLSIEISMTLRALLICLEDVRQRRRVPDDLEAISTQLCNVVGDQQIIKVIVSEALAEVVTPSAGGDVRRALRDRGDPVCERALAFLTWAAMMPSAPWRF